MKHELIKNRIADLDNIETPKGMTAPEAQYALNILQGYGHQQAYKLAIGGKAKGKTPDQLSRAAYKFKNKPLVQQYIKVLMKELERVAVATALDLQVFLSAAVFTPLSEITEDHPLCQKKTVTTRTDKDGATTVRVVYESVSKMDAAKVLIRMKGLEAPIRIDHTHRVGVMVVPMAASVEDWERLAAGAQQRLMQDAVEID